VNNFCLCPYLCLLLLLLLLLLVFPCLVHIFVIILL
jgi:hypothetical protein